MFSTTSFTIRKKLGVLALTAALGIGALIAFFIVTERALVLEERQNSVRQAVEAAHNILAYNHSLAAKGVMSEADAKRNAIEAIIYALFPLVILLLLLTYGLGTMRALQPNSRRFDMFCRHTSRSRGTVCSNHPPPRPPTVSAPAARRVASSAKIGSSPRPRSFQIASARIAGARAEAKSRPCRQRRGTT